MEIIELIFSRLASFYDALIDIIILPADIILKILKIKRYEKN